MLSAAEVSPVTARCPFPAQVSLTMVFLAYILPNDEVIILPDSTGEKPH